MVTPKRTRGKRLALACALALTAMAARAQAAPRTVVVFAEGVSADAAQPDLGADYTIGDGGAVVAALAKDQAKPPFGPAMHDPKKRPKLIAKIRKAAKAVGVDDVILVIGTPKKKGEADVVVVDVNDAVSEGHVAAGAPMAAAISTELAKLHAPSQAPATPAPTTTPAPAPTTPTPAPEATPAPTPASAPSDSPAASSPRQKNVVGSDLIDVGLGIEAGHRHFTYNDGITSNLRRYNLAAAPLFSLDAAIHPLAGSASSLARGLGIFGEYGRAFAVSSSSSAGGGVSTTWQRFHVGAGLRLKAGSSEGAPLFGVTGAFGSESFNVSSSDLAGQTPSVSYKFLRPAFDARIPIGRAAIVAAFGYRFVLSSGEVADRFTKPKVGGIDVELGGAYAIAAGFEARVTASYRRFFYTLHPVPGDTFVAGGALDELMGLNAGIAYVF